MEIKIVPYKDEIAAIKNIRNIVHAQAYIAPLYQQLGFKIIGEKFSEAGITHVKMIKQLSQNN